MANPIVIAYHIIWTAYATWLPNDIRGSGSRDVDCKLLTDLGELHFGRRKIQPAREQVREFYVEAEGRLRFPILQYDEQQRAQIAAGFAEAIATHRCTCYACSIMPDHVHMIIRKHKHQAEEMIENLQSASRLRLSDLPSIPYNHPIWTVGGWKVFIDEPVHLRSVIQYIERNPAKEGLLAQHWPFVMPYDNWPFHKGHNPNSPYARRLRGRN